jgi:hypothetical protein
VKGVSEFVTGRQNSALKFSTSSSDSDPQHFRPAFNLSGHLALMVDRASVVDLSSEDADDLRDDIDVCAYGTYLYSICEHWNLY